MLWQLQDYQEDKDHPQAQVVNVEVDELYVGSRRLGDISSYVPQISTTLQVSHRPVRTSRAPFPLTHADEGTRGAVQYGTVRARTESR